MRSMTSFKTICIKRVKVVGSVKLSQSTLQVELLPNYKVSIWSLGTYDRAHEQFTLDEHEKIEVSMPIYNETLAEFKFALTNIQALINQAHDELLTGSQHQDAVNPIPNGCQRGDTGVASKPQPVKTYDTLNPRGK